MLCAMLVAATMCLQGGEQVHVSEHIEPTASWMALEVRLSPPTGTLILYTPGYEEQPAQFSDAESFAVLPFTEPVLCVKAFGGPFEFNIEIMPIEDAE
jgi:hypothetical protein